ncbi:alpha/beta fold hydrolase [uncultured Algimonas sp.]|uniref:S9 family peptidase n=1 Tax=uncultured Algimonas sp. TaxID=1547920 RepID=UPI00261BEB27|nr:alpha/beta fold hydrolase [uncultured Algimonas sp.]
MTPHLSRPLLLVASVAALMVAGLSTDAFSQAPTVERVEQGNLQMENIPDIPAEVSERLRRYQNVRGHGFLDWVGDDILISTRFGEVSQIHRVDQPGGARQQITFYDEPVGGASVSPDGSAFLFGKDTGGDEFYQGYLYDFEGGDVTAFTEPGTRNISLVWSDDGSLVVWGRSREGDADTDIFAGDPADPGSARMIHEGQSAIRPVDVDETGDTVLLQQYQSITKSRLFILDVENETFTELNPDLDVAYRGGEFLSDGTILTASDADSEFVNLVRLDPKDGEMTSFTDAIDWDVQGFDLSPDGKTVVFGVNEGGPGTLKLLDLDTGAVRNGPDLPIGIVSNPTFNDDGSAVGFSFRSATAPTDAWSFDMDTMALTRWTMAEVGGLDTSTFVEPDMFDYPNADGMDIPAFIYRPSGDGPHPVIVSIHGGPESQSRPGFSSNFQYWVNELGAAVVVPNVRGSAGYGKTYVGLDNGLNRKRSVEDIGALLDWIGTQDDLDSDRIVVYGGSYGGYMVLASMIDYADRLAGGINIVGISDFKTFLQNTQDYRRDLRRAEYGDERDAEVAAFFEEISPLRNADRITKPIFIIQGYNDPRVPYTEAEQILEAVRDNGGEAWYLMAMDEGHGFRKKSNRVFQREAETLFLEKIFGRD